MYIHKTYNYLEIIVDDKPQIISFKACTKRKIDNKILLKA